MIIFINNYGVPILMARKLRLEYFREKCIGAAACTASHPERFFLDDEKKAVVKGASRVNGSFVLEREFSDSEALKIISAAEACPVNAYKLTDTETGVVLVNTAVETTKNYREIEAKYDDAREFQLDPNGYFLIRIDSKKKLIEVAFCGEKNEIKVKVTGKKPIDIYQTILREKIITRPDHSAYLGRELQKAYIALQKGIDYVQDDELDL